MKLLKIKLINYLIILYYFNFYKIFLNQINNSYLIKEHKVYSNDFLILKEMPINSSDPLILNEKEHILAFISKIIKKKVTSVKKIAFSKRLQFGNILVCLNKFIFFCEIIGCNEIILKKNHFWFLKRNLTLTDYNITISIIDGGNYENYKTKSKNNSDIIFLEGISNFFYYYKIKPNIRIHLFKYEIIKSLPKVNTSKNDLYIHIRSGDIFSSLIHMPYAQPPLCFYKTILQNFKFNMIYLISENNNNYVINKLIRKFNNIIYSHNSLKYDLSYLINSYNLVGSISSFLNIIIILNPNLQNFWEYNLYQMKEKILQNHYHLFDFPNDFTIYRMEPSKNYKNKMYIWKNNNIQRKLMIKEKCINSFIISRK